MIKLLAYILYAPILIGNVIAYLFAFTILGVIAALMVLAWPFKWADAKVNGYYFNHGDYFRQILDVNNLP